MARFKGLIGFVKPIEVSPGEYVEETTEILCGGDRMTISKKWTEAQNASDNVAINERLSVIYTKVLKANLGYLRYAVIDDIKWKIVSAEQQYPRLILNLGGIYNG